MSPPNPKSKQENSPDDKKQPSALDGLQFFFLFAWGFGTYYLFFKGEAANLGQLLFRGGLFTVGLVGSLAVMLVRVLLKVSED